MHAQIVLLNCLFAKLLAVASTLSLETKVNSIESYHNINDKNDVLSSVYM